MAVNLTIESCTAELESYLSMFLIDSDMDTKLPQEIVMQVW